MNKHKFVLLAESEIAKSEIVMGARAEIVEKIQGFAEKVANMKVDILIPLVQSIKAEHGITPAESFESNVSSQLDQLLQIMVQVQNSIDTECLKLTGDVESGTGIDLEFGADVGNIDSNVGEEIPNMDFSEMPPEEGEVEPMPVDRAEKEEDFSFESRKFGIMVESKKGEKGKKFFESKEQADAWFSKHKSKIATIKFLK